MHEFLSTENVAQECTVVIKARRLGGGGGGSLGSREPTPAVTD